MGNYWGSSPQFADLVYNVTHQPSASNSFFDLPAPTISQVSPTQDALAGGNWITLSGSGFLTGVTVEVGANTATSVVLDSASQIRALIPAAPSTGTVDVKVTNIDGQTATLTNVFTYTAPKMEVNSVLDFGTVYPRLVNQKQLLIRNTGNGILSVTGISDPTDDGQLVVEPTAFNVAAGSSQSVMVNLSVDSLGNFSQGLVI